MPESWQKYLPTLDKEDFRQAFNVLKSILLEDDLEFADRILKETGRYDSVSPEALEVTYKRLKENRLLYEGTIGFPSDLPSYEVDTAQYDLLLGGDFR